MKEDEGEKSAASDSASGYAKVRTPRGWDEEEEGELVKAISEIPESRRRLVRPPS